MLAALKEPRWPGGLRDALAWWPKFAQLARMAPQRVMMGVWSYLRQFTYIKFVVVVDEDIDARDWRQVIWASKRK